MTKPSLALRPCSAVTLFSLLAGCGQKADLVVTHGMVWTGLTSGVAQPGAVAIAGAKILAVGDSGAIARFIGSGTRVIDAKGGLVAPGFNDAHTHFIDGGFQLSSVDLHDAATPEEFVRRLSAFAGTKKPGEWIVGGNWDHTLWKGQPLPAASGSIRSRPTTPCSSAASTATRPSPTPPR